MSRPISLNKPPSMTHFQGNIYWEDCLVYGSPTSVVHAVTLQDSYNCVKLLLPFFIFIVYHTFQFKQLLLLLLNISYVIQLMALKYIFTFPCVHLFSFIFIFDRNIYSSHFEKYFAKFYNAIFFLFLFHSLNHEFNSKFISICLVSYFFERNNTTWIL